MQSIRNLCSWNARSASTSLAYLPQLQKAIPLNSTSDLSLKMPVVLSADAGR
jgi:hypothetical protein